MSSVHLGGFPFALKRDGAGVRIALVDSGVDRTHPWLAGAISST